MKKLKNLALCLSLGALTATLPYIGSQALPIIDTKEREIKAPLNILNIENKNTKRNQKEEMAEILVNLYNKYNQIFKKGLEINDVKNSNLYFNITKQKSEIKNLLDEIINYPYSIVNSKIEQKFLKSNVLFCYLINQYIQNENLDHILVNTNDIDDFKKELMDIYNLIHFSVIALDNSNGNYLNMDLNDKVFKLNNIIEKINDFESLKENFVYIKNTLNEINFQITSNLKSYIHI